MPCWLERTLGSVLSITFVIVRPATLHPWTGVLGSRWNSGRPGCLGRGGGIGARRAHPGGRDPAEAAHAEGAVETGLGLRGFRAARHPGCTCGPSRFSQVPSTRTVPRRPPIRLRSTCSPDPRPPFPHQEPMLAKPCWETPEFLGCLGGDGGGSRPCAPRGRHAESLEESLSSRVPLSPRLGCLPGSMFMFSLQIDCPRSSLRVCSSRTEHARAPDPGPPVSTHLEGAGRDQRAPRDTPPRAHRGSRS